MLSSIYINLEMYISLIFPKSDGQGGSQHEIKGLQNTLLKKPTAFSGRLKAITEIQKTPQNIRNMYRLIGNNKLVIIKPLRYLEITHQLYIENIYSKKKYFNCIRMHNLTVVIPHMLQLLFSK